MNTVVCYHYKSRKKRFALIGHRVSMVNMCDLCYFKYISKNGFSGIAKSKDKSVENYRTSNENDNIIKIRENTK